MFDANSADSVKDLATILQEDASPSMLMLLKDLAEELSKQNYLPSVSCLCGFRFITLH
jgi:hypothetical protein